MMNQRSFEVEVTTVDMFAEVVTSVMKNYFGQGYSVRVEEIPKNNGIVLNGLVITDGTVNIVPTIYLDAYYERFVKGESMVVLCREIISVYMEHRQTTDFDMGMLTTFERVKERICFRLVNAKLNEELLESSPHVMFHDLAVIFYVILSKNFGGVATVLVRRELQEIWGVDTTELLLHALSNTPEHLPVTVSSMKELLQDRVIETEMMYEMSEFEDIMMPPMYVVSNKEVTNGASCILYPDFLKEFTNTIGTDVYIIPSSVHETILVPATVDMDGDDLRDMVREINRTEVAIEERLSDNVYYYNRSTDRIEMA